MNTEVFDLGKIGITLGYEYDNKAIYEKLTIVLYKGKSYISTKTTKGVSPEQDNKIWQLIAEAKDAYHMLVDAGKTTLTEEEFLKQLEDATKGRYIVQGNVINAADEEDLTVEHSSLLGIDTLKLADRPSTDGMGYIILRKNKSFVKQVTKANTIYEIRYEFNLDGTEVNIPKNCVLKFDGGKIKNGTLICNNSIINAPLINIFGSDLVFEGTFINKEFPIEWFGASVDKDDNTPYINYAITSISNMNHNGGVLLITGLYRIKDTIILKNRISLKGVHFSDKQNSGDQSAPDKDYIASGFVYNFSNPNKWVIDEWRNNEIRPYNELYRDNSDVPNWSYVRKCGTCISNITIIQGPNSRVAFGGIRLSNSYNTKFENIHIAATFVGFCLNYVAGTFTNINCYCKVGFYFGFNSTNPNLYNCFIYGDIKWETSIIWELKNCVFRDKDKLFPPYCDINSAAFVLEGSDSDKTSPSLFGGGCQNVDAFCIAGIRAQINTNNTYFEGRYKTILWAYDGSSSVVGSCGGFLMTQGSFVFGTKDGYIYAKDIRFSTCYTGSNKKVSYVIDNSIGDYLYYDSYVINGEEVTDLVKSTNKIIVPYGDVKLNISNSYKYPDHPDYIQALRDVYSGTNGKYLALRDDIKSANILALESGAGFDAGTKIVNKYYRIYRNGTGAFILAMNNVYVEDSTIIVEPNIMVANRAGGNTAFQVSGKCRIEMKNYVNTEICQIELVGNKPIDLTLIVHNIDPVENFISNLDFTTKFNIHYVGRDGNFEKYITNSVRPINGLTIGDVHIENGKPIYWTGAKWVDATGANV